MGVTPEEFRACMGLRVSGVAVVTARAGDEVRGMTVSDFTSVSLDPPLLLVSADRDSKTLETITRSGGFALSILASDQEDLSNRFASSKWEGRRFEGLACEEALSGAPLLPGAHAHIDCRLEAQHEAGDHVLCVGGVEMMRVHEVEPLAYYSGGYRTLAPLNED
ncbi:MAG: flavin reductase family protein [Deltaproteobacteria bacterium]|nr:flavin reductase family protein [Deltaproteobacteria bacterium]MBW2418500.1 flavin reductase family protein [Deltaproteobacteria bacterium]